VLLRLTPRISYFSHERPGIIDFTEAQMSYRCQRPAGLLGGSTTKMHEVTRQIGSPTARAAANESHRNRDGSVTPPF
jgi:hypothetical protein